MPGLGGFLYSGYQIGQSQLNRLARALRGQLNQSMPMPNILNEAEFRREPETTTVQQPVVSREDVLKRINKRIRLLEKSYADLTERLHGHSEESSSWFSSTRSSKGYPSNEELLSFIDSVNSLDSLTTDYEIDVSSLAGSLLVAAHSLAIALSFHPRILNILDRLRKQPFLEHDEIDVELQELRDIYVSKVQARYISDHADPEHPLNKKSCLSMLNRVVENLKKLKRIKLSFNQFDASVKTADSEADLPTLDALEAIRTEVDRDFENSFCKAALLEHLRLLKVSRQEKLDDRLSVARQLAKTFEDQTTSWQERFDELKTDIFRNECKSFPWKSLPPGRNSMQEFQANFNEEVEALRKWPSAYALVSQLQCRVGEYDELLIRARDIANHKVQYMHTTKTDSTVIMQRKVEVYCRLLERLSQHGWQQAVDAAQLKLFEYAHKKYKQSQWLSIIRYSFWDYHQTVSWENIALLIKGGQGNYSGTRTKESLIELGWIAADGLVTKRAPTGLRAAMLGETQRSSVSFSPVMTS